MSSREQSGSNRITTSQMKEAIQHSGYLLEQRVEPIIKNSGYYVETNPIFRDPDTDKSREIDISALAGVGVYRKEGSFIFPNLLCECENNFQPIVFFTSEPFL
jgi:hypothetical protein